MSGLVVLLGFDKQTHHCVAVGLYDNHDQARKAIHLGNLPTSLVYCIHDVAMGETKPIDICWHPKQVFQAGSPT